MEAPAAECQSTDCRSARRLTGLHTDTLCTCEMIGGERLASCGDPDTALDDAHSRFISGASASSGNSSSQMRFMCLPFTSLGAPKEVYPF